MTTNANTTTQTAVAEPGAHVAPEKATPKRKTSKKQSAPKGKKTASMPAAKKDAKKPASKKATKPATKKATASIPREFSKKAVVLDLLRRKGGATMAEIAKATGWQNHSIRGFVSGTLTKKMGLAVESSKNEAGERVYRITGK